MNRTKGKGNLVAHLIPFFSLRTTACQLNAASFLSATDYEKYHEYLSGRSYDRMKLLDKFLSSYYFPIRNNFLKIESFNRG